MPQTKKIEPIASVAPIYQDHLGDYLDTVAVLLQEKRKREKLFLNRLFKSLGKFFKKIFGQRK